MIKVSKGYKLPRTHHLPWSPNKKDTSDKVHKHVDFLLNRQLVVTKKMDGECQCWTKNSFSLRSPDSKGGKLRSKARAKWAEIQWRIPDNKILFVEDISNMHSIQYPSDIPQFYLIAAAVLTRDKGVFFLPYEWGSEFESVIAYAMRFGLEPVPLLFETKVRSEEQLEKETSHIIDTNIDEGFVIRPKLGFFDWTSSTAKWVRENHVKTDEHWTRNAMRNL